MTRIQRSIEVGVPISIAYGQWTQFEEFPAFMEGIDSVVQRDDQFLDWTASVGGQTRAWTAKIVDQTPDVRIAWKAVEGAETAGTALGFLNRRIAGDLERFKSFIEERGQPTGAWEGEIHGARVTRT